MTPTPPITIALPTKDRARTIQTHRWLDASGIDYTIYVHDARDRATYSLNPTVDPARIVVTDAPYGMLYARQAILDRIPRDTWVLMLDDDLASVTALPEPWYNDRTQTVPEAYSGEWRRRYLTPITAARFLELVQRDLRVAETTGARLVGWSAVDNYYFRKIKYALVSYVVGCAIAVKVGDLRHDFNVRQMDDVSFTAQNLLAYGHVLVNKYIWPHGLHYQAGGLGTYDERLEDRLHDVEYLMATYPGLLRYKALRGQHPRGDVALRTYDVQRIAAWRRELLAARNGVLV